MQIKDFARHTIPEPRQRVVFERPRHSVLSLIFKIGVTLSLACSIALVILFSQSTWNRHTLHAFIVVFEANPDEVRKPMAVVAIEEASQTAVVLDIPEHVQIEALYGYGPYESAALYGLMSLEQLPVTYMMRTVSLQLVFQFRGFSIHTRKSQVNFQRVISRILLYANYNLEIGEHSRTLIV